MIVKKFICDRCSDEISFDEPLFMVFIEKKDREKLEDLGDMNKSTMDCHFCEKCKDKILAFIENEHEEVKQESSPSGRKRTTGEKLELDKQMAIEFHKSGKPIGEIARSLGHTYQCIKNWVQ